jgi:hypothetical protein
MTQHSYLFDLFTTASNWWHHLKTESEPFDLSSLSIHFLAAPPIQSVRCWLPYAGLPPILLLLLLIQYLGFLTLISYRLIYLDGSRGHHCRCTTLTFNWRWVLLTIRSIPDGAPPECRGKATDYNNPGKLSHLGGLPSDAPATTRGPLWILSYTDASLAHVLYLKVYAIYFFKLL